MIFCTLVCGGVWSGYGLSTFINNGNRAALVLRMLVTSVTSYVLMLRWLFGFCVGLCTECFEFLL